MRTPVACERSDSLILDSVILQVYAVNTAAMLLVYTLEQNFSDRLMIL